MLPLRLQLENFCGHSNSEIDFSTFSSALIVGKIRGNEKYSNGAGKSTIFNAIQYVLFNEIEFSTLDKIIRHGCDICRVQLDFQAQDEIYRIVRSKSKKSGSDIRLFKKSGEHWDDLSQRRSIDTEKELEKLLRINFKTFKNSILFSQSDLSGIASLTAEKRKTAFKDALQLGVYLKFESLAKKKTGEILTEITKLKTLVISLGDIQEKIKEADQQLAGMDDKLSELNANASEANTAYEAKKDYLTKLNAEIENYNKLSGDAFERRKILSESINKKRQTVEEFSIKIKKIESNGQFVSKELAELEGELVNLNSINNEQINHYSNDLEKISNSIIEKKAAYKTLLSNRDKLMIPLPSGTSCEFCRQQLSEDHIKKCQADIHEELKSVTDQLGLLKSQAEKLIDEENNLKTKVSSIRKDISRKEILTESLKFKKKEITDLRALYLEFNKIIGNASEELKQKNQELASLEEDLKKSDNANLKTNYTQIQKELSLLKNRLDLFNNEIKLCLNKQAVLLHTKEERENDLKKIEEYHNKILKLEGQFNLHQKVVQAFGSTGIPSFIIHTILDDLQIETNNLLLQIRPELQLQFIIVKAKKEKDVEYQEDTLDIKYINHGQEIEFAQLSGAQKLMVALSLKLGLASIIRKRLGIDLKLLLIDEADQSLDEGGIEAFEDVIKTLQKDYKILVITHNNSLKDKFSHAILVEQDESSISTAKLVTTW